MGREEYKKLKPILEAKKEEEERRKKQEARMKEVDLEAKASEKKSQTERKGDDSTVKEEKNREEARRTTVERVQRVRLQEPKGLNGPQKTESPQVLERMEVPVRPSDPIEESCDAKSDKPMSKEEETEVGHIPVEKTCLAGPKEHPMETKEQENPGRIWSEESIEGREVEEYPKEEETRRYSEEGRQNWDRKEEEESSSEVSSPSTTPMDWPKEEYLEVLMDENENGYWSDSTMENSVTDSVDGWLEVEERKSSPLGGWRPSSPESERSHYSNASTREHSPRRDTILNSHCRVVTPVKVNVQVDQEESEEEEEEEEEEEDIDMSGGGLFGDDDDDW